MPIYEYRAGGEQHCELCRRRFEVRQGFEDKPLSRCPQCGSEIVKLFSRSFISVMEPLSVKETFGTHTAEEADSLGLEGGFAEDQIWD